MANSAFYSKQEAKGRVKEACKGFLLKADEQFASKLQDEEFNMHYDKNRKTNQDMRVNVSTVKSIENSEYQDLLMRHQMLEKLEKEDAMIAMQMQNEFMSYHDNPEQNNQVLTDEELAKKLQEHELLYEEYSGKKSSSQTKKHSFRSNTNQYESLVDDMNLLSFTDKPFYKKANKRDSINFERANEYGLFEDDTKDDDFELAKYLQEEERKKIQIQNKIRAQSLQLTEMSDEKLAHQIQLSEAKIYQNENKKCDQLTESSKKPHSSNQTALQSRENQQQSLNYYTSDLSSGDHRGQEAFRSDRPHGSKTHQSPMERIIEQTHRQSAQKPKFSMNSLLEKEVQILNLDNKLSSIETNQTNDLIDLSEADNNKFNAPLRSSTSHNLILKQNIRSSRSTSSNSTSSISSFTNWSPIVYKEPENSTIFSKYTFESESDIGESSLLFSTTPPHNETVFDGFVTKNRSSKSNNSKKSLFDMSFNFDNTKHSDESFEEENLIEDNEKYEKDIAKSDFLVKNKSKCNIVETIDPTFKLKKMNSQSKFIQDIKTSYSSKTPSSNLKYEACSDNDTDTFLPVQGQKRSNCKMVKKKKSQTQCLQQ